MSKELFMDAHADLVEEYLEHHPECSEDQAYEDTADLAYGRMRSNLFDRADHLRDQAKGN